jgi:hypothetical protein
MLVTVIATICLNGLCVDKTVTDQATLGECTVTAQQSLTQWMELEGYTARGYRLARWRCDIGGKRTPA